MPRARKSTLEALEDQFCDLPVDQQSALLHTLGTLHRQSLRQDKRQVKQPIGVGTDDQLHLADTETVQEGAA